MMRSLWTAASGMKAQQTAMDNLSNNLANINTTGYKKERLEFQSLLYQTIQKKTTDNEGNPKPIGAQVGLGVKVAAISTEFEQGELTHTEGDFDFAIQGNGFFMIQMPDGSTAYTRNGHFTMAVNGTVISCQQQKVMRFWILKVIRLHLMVRQMLLNYRLTIMDASCYVERTTTRI